MCIVSGFDLVDRREKPATSSAVDQGIQIQRPEKRVKALFITQETAYRYRGQPIRDKDRMLAKWCKSVALLC